MTAVIDLTGQRFGQLVVLARAGSRHGFAAWRCSCDCGNEAIVTGASLRGNITNSCGHLRLEVAGKHRAKHYGKRDYPAEYEAWCDMKRRCYNPNYISYPNYGRRGIRVCKRWRNDFVAFLTDVGLRPSPKHSIDRINNDGNYEPRNVRWATRKQQANNRRPRSR